MTLSFTFQTHSNLDVFTAAYNQAGVDKLQMRKRGSLTIKSGRKIAFVFKLSSARRCKFLICIRTTGYLNKNDFKHLNYVKCISREDIKGEPFQWASSKNLYPSIYFLH